MGRAMLLLGLLVVLSLAPLASSHPVGVEGSDTTKECGGFAPARTRCNTGTHVQFVGVLQEIYFEDGYTGRINSTLEPQAGLFPRQVLSCVLLNGTPVKPCTLEGPPPPVGVPFVHFCESRRLEVASFGVAPFGGNGQWVCRVRHT